ncbi:hypothetical protein HMPREF1544_06762 [Mucor circinelloides 1006PhL]|uniref:GAR domain-containing protein n=1 Tax=Mucor circinelloides f. circinelloides (strain 1006PhL) TaxID=1220926 RepID=S2JA08_MUCC1|nr:hypothetical protein HMPREF1544_06762 [Mucor circinelloides 1006PhL]
MSKGSGGILKASGHINQQQQPTGNPRVSYSTSSTFTTTTTTTTALYTAAFAKVDMILASSTSPTSSSSTVLAWLQKELSLYVDLHLMSIPVDLTAAMDWLAKPLVCLAHRYFPDQFLNLSEQLQNHATTYKKALQVFEDRLHVVYDDGDADISNYLACIQKALSITDDATLRDLHIRDSQSTDFDLTIGIPLTQLWQHWTELAKQESLSSTTTASTRSSPSPRIEPMQSRDCWEDIETSLQQMQPQYQSFQQAIINNTDIPPDLAVRISAIDATHAALSAQMQRPTIEFATTVAYIRNELEFIQAKMLKTTTTDAGIHDLEVRSTKVGTLIDHLARYDMDDGQHQHYQALLHKYQLIVSWVDDVRVWFVEAERIRGWIEQRIQLLETKQSLNALEEVEYDYTPEQIDGWNQEHDRLQKEVEAFDAHDMTRLRAHVKQLTSTHKDLSPADTTTIEITFTTLTTLDRLMHLLRRHAYELQMLTLRMAWEQSYHVTVAWVRSVAEQVKQFVQDKARWRANDDDVQQDKNSIINTLIQFEQQSAHFDQGQFTNTVNLYQDMDDACHIELPSHLESRQVAIEEGFEELTHRISFARQVVEQYLVVTDFLAKADQLKNEGEVLRQEIVSADVSAVSTTELSEKVVLFQEHTVRLVTGVAARVPYPEATHPSDQQGNDDANEMIRMVIGSRKSALVLFGEALDHSLSALRRALQLQKRAKQLQDEMTRLGGWVDERLKAMEKSKVDVFVAGKCALDETDLARLIKERDGQVTKLKGIQENEYKKLQENISAMQQSSVSQHNVISSQVSALHDGMGTLGDQLKVLEEALELHSSRLAILGRRISWETQHAKASVWLSNHIFAVWDFVSRKAQWRVSTMMDIADEEEEADSDSQAGSHWRSQVQVECDGLVSKIQALYTEQLKPVEDVYNELLSDFESSPSSAQVSTAIEYVQRRQDTLNQSYQNINDLITYAQQVLDQHEALTDFTRQVGGLQAKGQQIKLHIQQAIDSVMQMGENHHLKESVQEFSQAVMQLWMQTGSQLPYPVCPEDARTTRPSTNDDEISTEVATAVYKAYTDLQALSNTLSDMVQRLDVGLMYRVRLEQWCVQVQHTTTTITDVTSTITSYSFDLTTGIMTQNNQVVEQGRELEHELQMQRNHCHDDVDNINQQLVQIQNAMTTDDCNMLDLSITEKPATLLEESCKALDQSMNDFKQHLQVCEDRAQWHVVWLHQSQTLNGLQEAMLEWINQKAWWISTFDGEGGGDDTLLILAKQLQVCHLVLQDCLSGHEELKGRYSALVNSYKVATGTVLEDTQQSSVLHLSTKLQEAMKAQLADIQQLQERHDWASRVDQELKACANKELATESFIQLYARWSPSNSTNHQDLTDKVDKLHQATTSHISAMDALLNQVIQQQTEPIFRRRANLESTKHSLEQQDLFLDKVVEQQKALCTILDEINQAESLAESKKSLLLSLSQPSSQDLQEYKQHVDQVNALIENTMIYPVRHYRDHNPRARELDTSHNAGLQDMLKARQSRLTELGSTLESILKSKERLSRRKAAEASYFAEAHVVDEWIDAKHTSLNEEKEDLKSAVAQVNALQSAITNYTASVHGLEVAANKCVAVIQQQQGEDDAEDTAQSAQRIHDKQAYIDMKWHQLQDTIAKVQHQRQQELQHQEFMALLKSFNTQCGKLQEELQQDVGQISESVCAQWQDELQALNAKLSELTLQAQGPGDVADAAALYDTLKEQVQLRSTEANHYRLKQEYAEGATALESLMTSAKTALTALVQKSITMHGDSEQDKALLENVHADYNACCQMLDQEKYDEQRSFYRFLQLNKVHDLQVIDDCQSQLEKQWKQIKQELADYQQKNIKSLLQWQELHSKLNEIKDEALEGVLDRLEHFELSDFVPTFLDQDASLLTLLRHRATACLDIATSLPQEDDNMSQFKEKYDDLIQQVDAAGVLLSEKRTLAQQHVDVIECEKLVASFCSQVTEQVDAMQADSVSDATPSASTLESLYKQASGSYMTRETTQQALKHQLMSIESRIDNVSKKYNVDNTHMHQTLKEAMSDLNTKLSDTAQVNDVMRRVLGHSKSAENIKSWLDNCQTAIAELEHQNESTALDLAGLTQKMSDFQKVMQSFLDLSQEVESIHCNQAIVHHMVDGIVKPTTGEVRDQWQKTQADLKVVETEIEKTTRGVGVARKMKHVMALVGETRDYLDRTRLYDYDAQTEDGSSDEDDDDKTQVATDDGKKEEDGDADNTSAANKDTLSPLLSSLPRQGEIEDIEKRLKATESEMLPQVEQELNELDNLMKEFDTDMAFTRQYVELKESVQSLQHMFTTKYATLDKCMAIGIFLSTADDIEILQSSLEEAVSQSAPHHSLIGTLSRTDLQAKLIELDARFKYYERKIVPSLTLAQEQAKTVTELTAKGGEAVHEQLQEMDRKWTSIKKQFKTRKIELSRTIDTSQDSKDQHARIRKSSLPTRKASSLLRDRADVARQRLSPTASSTSSSSSSSRTTSTTRLPSRYLAPPPHQPSKSATHLKSRTTNKITKPPLNSYVADPDNDLDIEIGRIVNETPYRVKVKMVPGEVGRYWFGNLNPKLAYCRVLKSKMVMVRVGGGWTELSQFLRDHALLEGDFIPRHKKKNTAAVIPEEEEPKSPTIQEGFIETHRQHHPHRAGNAGVTGSPSHSATTTTSGYKEGDKFIAVDSHGNQLQVQMRKAPNNFMHTSSSSSTTNTSGSSLSNHSHMNDYTKRRIARRKEKKPVAAPTTTTTTTPSSQSSSSK